MIRTETIIREDGVELIRTYSDRGVMIHGGMPEDDYTEATDPASFGRTYTETDIPAEGDDTAEDVLSMLEEAL